MGNFEINIDPPQPSGGVVEIRGGGPIRGVLAIVVCLVIVIVLVVVLGRSRDKTVTAPPTTTLVESTTTTTEISTTTSSEATTTTTVAAVQVYGPLLPDKTGASLLVVQADADLVQIDVDSGTVTNLLPGLRVENTYQMFALSHGVVISGESQPRLVADGEITNVGTIDQMIGTPDGIHILSVSYSGTGTELVSIIPGGSRDPVVPLPAGSDPVALVPGAVLLQSRAGGVYTLDLASGGVRKIAEGAFIALKGDRLASLACDDSMKCHISIGPLGGRPQHQVPVDAQAFNIGYAFFYGQSMNALSPARDLLAYTIPTQRAPQNVVLDLHTGNVVLVGTMSTGASGPSPFVWSPDGRWLFWVDAGQVMAWSPDRGGEPIGFANADAGSAQMIAAGYSL